MNSSYARRGQSVKTKLAITDGGQRFANQALYDFLNIPTGEGQSTLLTILQSALGEFSLPVPVHCGARYSQLERGCTLGARGGFLGAARPTPQHYKYYIATHTHVHTPYTHPQALANSLLKLSIYFSVNCTPIDCFLLPSKNYKKRLQ